MSLIDAAGRDELCPPEENKIKKKNTIEVKCSKAQFNRIMTNLSTCGCLSKSNGLSVCILGKTQYTCPAINGKNPNLSCTECLRRNIKHTPQ